MLQVLNTPWLWFAHYTLGLLIGLSVLANPRRQQQAAGRMPKPVLMLFILIFMILPPLVLPFTTRSSMGLPQVIAIGFGGVLFTANIILKIAGQRRIGAMPGLKSKGTLVTEGVYGYVRHPLYLSNILMALGMALLLNSLYGLLFSIYYSIGFCLIIYFEEKGLIASYGDQYRAYQQRVRWRMIPYIY